MSGPEFHQVASNLDLTSVAIGFGFGWMASAAIWWAFRATFGWQR